MLKSFSLFQKLVIANILYSIPVIALIYLMVAAQNVNIDFAVQEKKGNLIQRPLESLLQSFLEAKNQVSFDKQFQVANVDTQMDKLKKSLDEVGEDLQFTEAGLKQRNRSQVLYSQFATRWGEFKSKSSSMKKDEVVSGLVGFIGDVRTMITHAGDTSNLILDPDLDSYYLMDVTLVALPQSQDRISEIINFLSKNRGQLNKLNQEDLIQTAVYSALAKQSDLDRTTGDLQTTLNEDPNFYGVSDGLKNKLKPAVDDYQAKMEAFIAQLDKIVKNPQQVKEEEVFASAQAAFEASFSSWNVGVDELDTLLQKRTESLTGDKYKSLLIALLALALAVAVLYFISSSFNSNMKLVIDKLVASVTRTQESGNELVVLSQDLSAVSEDQASALQQTSSAITQIDSMIKATLENTTTTRETANDSHESAVKGGEAIKNLISAIDEIASSNQNVLEQVDNSRHEMEEITKIISDIGDKTKVINDIVFQTKLLSFNASVEAARAGEAGKGFSVVAEEVGSLAKMSGEASNEISSMLDSGVHKVKTISEVSNSKVENLIHLNRNSIDSGIHLANECNEAIDLILDRVKDVLLKADSIQVAADEQARGIQEVSTAVQKLDEIAQKNMNMSKKTAQQSQEVTEQAKSLQEIVKLVQTEVLGSKAS